MGYTEKIERGLHYGNNNTMNPFVQVLEEVDGIILNQIEGKRLMYKEPLSSKTQSTGQLSS